MCDAGVKSFWLCAQVCRSCVDPPAAGVVLCVVCTICEDGRDKRCFSVMCHAMQRFVEEAREVGEAVLPKEGR